MSSPMISTQQPLQATGFLHQFGSNSYGVPPSAEDPSASGVGGAGFFMNGGNGGNQVGAGSGPYQLPPSSSSMQWQQHGSGAFSKPFLPPSAMRKPSSPGLGPSPSAQPLNLAHAVSFGGPAPSSSFYSGNNPNGNSAGQPGSSDIHHHHHQQSQSQ